MEVRHARIVVQGNITEVYPNCPIEVDSLPTQIDCARSTTIDTVSVEITGRSRGSGTHWDSDTCTHCVCLQTQEKTKVR